MKNKKPKEIKSRKWVWDSANKNNLIWTWCSCIAWYRLPQWLCRPVITIYTSKNGGVDMYCDQEEMGNCSKSVVDKLTSDKNLLGRFSYECQIEQDKLRGAANDIDALKFGGLPDEILYKVYEILLNQYTEVCKYYNIASAASKEGKNRLEKYTAETANGEKTVDNVDSADSHTDSQIKNLTDMLSEMDNRKEQIKGVFSETIDRTKRLFSELSKRTGQKEEVVMLMTPEEVRFALHTGKIEEWEIEGRSTHYIMLYDLEKDDPLVYTLEKARVMELSFKFEKPSSQ